MNSDRKSAVSSFYGGRKNSLDALNSDFPSPPTTTPQFANQPHIRHDSTSSFFDPNQDRRGSADLLNPRVTPSAGYNRMSFFDAGRQEPLKGGRDEEEEAGAQHQDAWDVYADFNNAGPRYSTAFVQNDSGYRQIPGPLVKPEDIANAVSPVELVTVPTLGPEWKASEMRDMTKAGKREKIREEQGQKWKDWNRGNRGLCGKWFTRRTLVFTLFAICVAVAIVLAFTIPRVPSFSFNGGSPLQLATAPFNKTVPVEFSHFPVNFTFPAVADLQLNTGGNYLPLTLNGIDAQVFDLTTNAKVATGHLSKTTVPAKSFPVIQLPLNFTYLATNLSDVTWTNWYNACRNPGLNANGTRPGIGFSLVLSVHIEGLVGSRESSTEISNAPCPITLAINAS